MRRFLRCLCRLDSSAAATHRGPRTTRPGLEVLEGRDVPSTLSNPNTGPAYALSLQLANNISAVSAISQPCPTMLIGKSVTLAQTGTPSNTFGVLQILGMTLQADGSYFFGGTFQTSSYSIEPTRISITGTLGAPQYTNVWTASCSVFIDTSFAVTWNNQTVWEHVHYAGTVTLTPGQATTSGNLYDCLEDGNGHPIFPGTCRSPAASGTFV
jgi:hypothetical protein